MTKAVRSRDEEAGTQRPPRKRRRVAESDRQRSSIACSNCRRLKEKCDGQVPCGRCRRLARKCELSPAGPRGQPSTAKRSATDDEEERIAHLETVARHFLGDVPLTVNYLRRAVPTFQTDVTDDNDRGLTPEALDPDLEDEHFMVKTISQNTVHYSGELSHWTFSQRVKRSVDKRLRKNDQQDVAVVELWRASHLRSEDWISLVTKHNLPPRDVALFLIQIYFDYAEINDFYVSQDWLYQKFESLYSFNEVLCAEDAAWITTVIMTMAIGSQFAHMTERNVQETPQLRNDEDEATENAVGMTLFHLGSRLIPDMVAVASVESMQAFMLLAHFALPLDTPGIAYTYIGLALKMGIQNGLHRGYRGAGLSEETFELRTRLFWTAYRLDTRISIMHGRPPSMRLADIDVTYPSISTTEPTSDAVALRHRENLATKLTHWLLDFAESIHLLRRCSRRIRSAYLDRLLQTRQRFKSWWASQPISSIPRADISRSDAHLHLCYNINLVFMGRPFMFTDSRESQNAALAQPSSSFRNELVQDAVAAAFEITDLCAALDGSTGLARASYVEFSSIRAALLAMLAQCLNERTVELQEKLNLGMRLIRSMAVGILSTKSEASVISAIEAAIRQLEGGTDHLQTTVDKPESEVGETRDMKYQRWTSLWQDHPDAPGTTEQPSPLPAGVELSDVRDFLGDLEWTPFDPSLFDTNFVGAGDGGVALADWPYPLSSTVFDESSGSANTAFQHFDDI